MKNNKKIIILSTLIGLILFSLIGSVALTFISINNGQVTAIGNDFLYFVIGISMLYGGFILSLTLELIYEHKKNECNFTLIQRLIIYAIIIFIFSIPMIICQNNMSNEFIASSSTNSEENTNSPTETEENTNATTESKNKAKKKQNKNKKETEQTKKEKSDYKLIFSEHTIKGAANRKKNENKFIKELKKICKKYTVTELYAEYQTDKSIYIQIACDDSNIDNMVDQIVYANNDTEYNNVVHLTFVDALRYKDGSAEDIVFKHVDIDKNGITDEY